MQAKETGPYWIRMGEEWIVAVVENEHDGCFVYHTGNDVRYPIAEYEGKRFVPILPPE